MLALLSWVAAAEPVVTVRVTDAAGAVVLDEVGALPIAWDLATDGRRPIGLSIYATRFDQTRGMVELAVGPTRDGRIRRHRFRHTRELDPWRPVGLHARWRDAAWDLVVTFHARVAPPPVGPAPAGDDRFVVGPDGVGRVVGAPDGERFAVAPAGEGHCAAAAPAGGEWSRQVLTLVTTRPLEASFPDGTGHRVAAGVPVRPLGGQRFAVSTGGLSFEVEVGDGDLDVSYAPSGRFPAAPVVAALPPGPVGRTALGEVRWEGEGDAPVVGLDGPAPLATVQTPCAEVRLLADPAALAP